MRKTTHRIPEVGVNEFEYRFAYEDEAREQGQSRYPIPLKGIASDRVWATTDFQCCRPFGAESWMLCYTIAGAATFTTQFEASLLPNNQIFWDSQYVAKRKATPLRVTPGDAVLVPTRVPHHTLVCEKAKTWEFFWAHFHPLPQWMPFVQWPEFEPGLMHVRVPDGPARKEVDDWFALTRRTARVNAPRRSELTLNAFERLLLLLDVYSGQSGATPIDPSVRTAIEYIMDNLAERFALSDVARASSQSLSRLTHVFNKQVGTTPQQFIEKHRLERAAQMLRSGGSSIGEIALQAGFGDAYYFSTRFRKRFGVSPREYRANAKDGS